jgi:hypothetical protein
MLPSERFRHHGEKACKQTGRGAKPWRGSLVCTVIVWVSTDGTGRSPEAVARAMTPFFSGKFSGKPKASAMDGLVLTTEARRRRRDLPANLPIGVAANTAEPAVAGAAGKTASLLRKPVIRQAPARCVAAMPGTQCAP